MIEELHNLVNEVSNGMMLDVNAFSVFNDFCWCLKQTEVGVYRLCLPFALSLTKIQIGNVYTWKVFKRIDILNKPKGNLVAFSDYSGTFNPHEEP
jgi:hypothetical protein